MPTAPADSGPVALVGATVIDGTSAAPRRAMTVVIEGGRITYVGPAAGARIPASARRLDLTGKWLIPGFVDTHVHLPVGPNRSHVLNQLLSFGITAMRVPVGGVTALRDSIERGETIAPTVRTAGDMIDADDAVFPYAVRVHDEAGVRREVRRQAALRVDFIKLYTGLPPDLAAAAIDEAHAHGLKVIGHLGRTTWGEAAASGIDALTHSYIAGLAHSIVPAAEREALRGFYFPNAAFEPALFDRWQAVMRADSSGLLQLAERLSAARITVDPNLVLGEAILFGDQPSVLERNEPTLALPAQQVAWRGKRHPYSESWTPAQMASAQRAWPVMLGAIRTLHARGVHLTAGTDLNNPWMVAGTSLHRELELLVSAGIPPLDVLTIATRNGAEAVGLLHETGTIAAGKRADLVVLGGDPVADIRNTRKVERVWLGGRELDPVALMPASRAPGARP